MAETGLSQSPTVFLELFFIVLKAGIRSHNPTKLQPTSEVL
jgi:hypothetical protein